MAKVILGVNLDKTISGKALADGASAIAIDGVLKFAIAEERISKNKHCGGFILSADACLKNLGLHTGDVDLVVVSTCCEIERVPDLNSIYKNAKIVSCNHHLSHALAAYVFSGFKEQSLICVLDGGGNVFNEQETDNWWEAVREQQSYYLANQNGIEKVEIDFSDPYSMGFGEVYRSFTKFLGLGSSEHAGKVMALAAYGDPQKYKNIKLFDIDSNGRITSQLFYDKSKGPDDVVEIVSLFLDKNGINSREVINATTINQHKADMAAWLQTQIEQILANKIRYLISKYNVNNVCVSGGVAYNCRANGFLLREFPNVNFFFPPFSGDIGQSVGNVCFGLFKENNSMVSMDLQGTFLGSAQKTSLKEILSKLNQFDEMKNLLCYEPKCIYEDVARLIADGKIGAFHEGRSEIGPRALGNRSILARADCTSIRDRINKTKNRALYMPLAPAMLKGTADKYFHLNGNFNYNLMTVAVRSRSDFAHMIKGCIHKDKTARLQIIANDSESTLSNVLKSLQKYMIDPVIINTSFNVGGMPISEDENDAISYFTEMELDFLVINGVLVRKNVLFSNYYSISEFFINEYGYYSVSFDDCTTLIKDSLGFLSSVRKYFVLYEHYADWFLQGKKITTIRFVENCIDFISSSVLALYTNKDFKDEESVQYLTDVHVSKVIVKKFIQLTEVDAINDGFANLAELQHTLRSIYSNKINFGYVTIYYINKCAVSRFI